jgi:hypothetical protein
MRNLFKLYSTFFSLFVSFYCFAQKSVTSNQGDKFNVVNINNLGFYFNYTLYDKQLNLLGDTYQLENKSKLNREFYEGVNLNILSAQNKVGEIYFRDTIHYNSNLNIEDIHHIVRGILSQNYLRDFDYGKTGIYYFNVLCDISWYQGVYLSYKIILNQNFVVLECKQTQTFSISEGDNPEFEETGMDYYNSKNIGIYETSYKNLNGGIEYYNRFRKNKAYNQLYFISILNEVRLKLRNYYKDYFTEISEQKIQLGLK